MLPTRTNGLLTAQALSNQLDRVINEFWTTFPGMSPWGFVGTDQFPAINLWETADNLEAEVELPGMRQENIEVFVRGNELTLRGQRPDASKEGVVFHRRERGTGEFSRVVRLPVAIEGDSVEARFQNGVLRLSLPKAKEARPRKIEVSSVS